MEYIQNKIRQDDLITPLDPRFKPDDSQSPSFGILLHRFLVRHEYLLNLDCNLAEMLLIP